MRLRDRNENELLVNVWINYTIYFADEQQMDVWYAFVKKLKNDFKDYENISDRILRYIAEVYDENNMSESERILKFIGQDVDG